MVSWCLCFYSSLLPGLSRSSTGWFHSDSHTSWTCCGFPNNLCNFPKNSVTWGTESVWLNDFSQLSLSSCSSTLKQLIFRIPCVCVRVHRVGKAALFSLTWLLKLCCGSSAAFLVKCCTLKTCVTCSFLFHHSFYHWLQTILLAIFFSSKLPGRWRWCALSSGGDHLISAELLTDSLKLKNVS